MSPEPHPPAPTASEKVVRQAGIASFAVLLSRISGLVREVVMARLFGAGMANDAFQLGFRIPNLTRDLFAEGALSSAFVPTFVETLKLKSKEDAIELANQVANGILLVVGVLCLIGILASPWIIDLIAPDWRALSPPKYELAVRLTQIMFPFLLLVALAAQAMGVLNSLNQFAVPALSSTFFNIGSVASGLFIGFVLGPRLGFAPIFGMAAGVVLGGTLQLAVQAPSLYRSGFRFHPTLRFDHPGLRKILHLMGPAILGNSAILVNVTLSTWFAQSIDDPVSGTDGPVSWLNYAFRFMQLPIGLFGVALGTATLPAISRSAASENMEEFRETLSRSLGLVFLLTLPASVGLVLLGRSVVGAIYEGSRFNSYDTQQTGLALSCYCVGLAGYAAVKVLNPAFYALKDSRVPMMASLGSIAVNYGMGMLLVRQAGWGHAGLALATSTVALVSFLFLFETMRRRIGGVNGRRLRSAILRVSVASMAMGAAIAASNHVLLGSLGAGPWSYRLNLLVSIPLGLAVFYGVCRGLRVEDLDFAVRALAGPIARRLKRA